MLLNANGDGTHSFNFWGSDGKQIIKQDDVRFLAGELQDLISQARGTLRLASWDNETEWQENTPYKYQDQRRDLTRLKRDLTNLARWGYRFYTQIQYQLRTVSGDKGVENFEK